MTRRLSIFTLFLLITSLALGQSYFSRWQYTWGGDRQDFLNIMIPLPGNKYFIAGTAASNISCNKTSTLYGDEDFVAMVFDDNGNKLWEKSYGGTAVDRLSTAIKVPGGFMLFGITESGPSGIKTSGNNGTADFWLVKIDDNGDLIWEKSYGGADLESGVKILAAPDGGFLLAGLSLSNNPGYNYGKSDYQLMKVDGNGTLLWSKLYGGNEPDDLHDLVPTSDGNYFLCGTSQSPVGGNKTSLLLGGTDIWLVKVNADGTKIWDKTYGTSGMDYDGTLLKLSDGNTLLVRSDVNNGYIRKIDNDGNEIWEKACEGGVFNVATEDFATGNIVVAGMSNVNSAGCKTSPFYGGGSFGDIWISVFDANGIKTDDEDFGGNDADFPTSVQVLNGEIWITSWSVSPLTGNKITDNCGQTADGWILRLARKFYISNATSNAVCSSAKTLKVYFKTSVNFNPGNVFTAQLSDAGGSFLNPINIGTLSGIKYDSIPVTLPANLPEGNGYRLRVVASLVADTTAPYQFWIYGLNTLNLGKDTSVCAGSSFILDPGVQPPNSKYTWQDGTQNSFFAVTIPGIYWCQVKNSCGVATDSIGIFHLQKPQLDLGPDIGFCSKQIFTIQPKSFNAGIKYLWSTGDTTSAISKSKSGLFWLRASNVCGIVNDTLYATENVLPQIMLTKDSVICSGSILNLSAVAGFDSYLWNTGETTNAIKVNNTGTYSVKVTDKNLCVNRDSVFVNTVVKSPADFLPGDSAICLYQTLYVIPSKSFSSYLWSTGEFTKTVTVFQPSRYWLQVTDRYGCIGRDSIILSYKQCAQGFFVPTAFTPNGDRSNDLFKPLIFGNLKTYRFRIFNRYGTLVFESSDFSKGWDGLYKNTGQNGNVFVWTCSYQMEGEKQQLQKGSVVLLR